jgi:hypothetical protein
MRNVFFSLFAIFIAGAAAIAATTAMLETPMRIGPTTTTQQPPGTAPQAPAPAPEGKPAPATGATAGGAAPGGAAPAAGKPGDKKAGSDTADDEKADKDPYEGIAPEDLPPDLQYNADSSVSFPTNI